jgi:hypothetical protein|tara:strand:- start:159 stop:353 length:195 start_codon:yes stop_codon:yes gene_type:complete
MTLPIDFIDNVFKNVQKQTISSNVTITSPIKVGVVRSVSDLTVDIENGVQVDVDDGCVFIIKDL